MGLIIVERTFEHPPTDADLDVVAERMKQCKEIRSITWKRSVLSRDRRRMICEFEAPDAETVRRVSSKPGHHSIAFGRRRRTNRGQPTATALVSQPFGRRGYQSR